MTHNNSPQAFANVIYWLTRLERRLEREGCLESYRAELAGKYREYAVDAYRDGVAEMAEYCAYKVAEHDPAGCTDGVGLGWMTLALLGIRNSLRAKGCSARARRWAVRTCAAIGFPLVPEEAAWVAELPLNHA
ncbi:MAG TPA: hypothetical protein PK280_18920 [Planctomycetota bacterium]|nr:hypothetical protein [Planctomycetota bacterium]